MLFHQEDMNLSEDKKTPLRDKDLHKKKEMVIQYICTASKTVSFFLFFFQFCHLCLVANLANTKYYTGWYFLNILVGAKMYKGHGMQYQRHTCSGVT